MYICQTRVVKYSGKIFVKFPKIIVYYVSVVGIK